MQRTGRSMEGILEEAIGTRGEHMLPRGVAGGKMAWQTRNRWGPGTGQVTPCGTGPLFPRPQSSRPGPPRPSPPSAPWGPRPWPSPGVLQRRFPCLPSWALYRGKNRQTRCHGLVLSPVRVDRMQGWVSGLEQLLTWKSGQRCEKGCREDTPQTPPPWWSKDSGRGGQQLSLFGGCPRKDEGHRPECHHRPLAHCSSNYGSRKA